MEWIDAIGKAVEYMEAHITEEITAEDIAKDEVPGFWWEHYAAGYCIEMYEDATKYPNGTQDENYYCEIWIPVKRK